MNNIYIPKKLQTSIQQTENERMAKEIQTLTLERLELFHVIDTNIKEKNRTVKVLRKMIKNSEFGTQQTTLNLYGLMNTLLNTKKLPVSYNLPATIRFNNELDN